MPRIGLCRRCNRIRKAAETAQAQIDANVANGVDLRFQRDSWDLRLALKRVEIAKREGARYGPLAHDDSPSGLELEHSLTWLAGFALGDRGMYYGHASALERTFTADERRKIVELLAPLGRALFRKSFERLCIDELMREDTVTVVPAASGPVGRPLMRGEQFGEND